MANCTKCGKQLRSDNTKGFCGDPQACDARVYEQRDAGPAEAPPKTKKVKRAPAAAVEPAGPDFQKQFFELAGALGLNPEGMLTEFCRDWVEKTRAKALGHE